jgi:hypothetical protein
MYLCYKCKKELPEDEIRFLQRRDTCMHCGAELRCCHNCRFWDENASLCREGVGDFIRDREKANFCSQFSFNKDRQAPEIDKIAEAKARLDALFKKK